MSIKLYYADNWQREGIKEFTVSDAEEKKAALALPGVMVNPVPRQSLHTTLEAACGSVCAAIDAQIEELQGRVAALQAARATFSGADVEVHVVAPSTTERRQLDQKVLQAKLASRK